MDSYGCGEDNTTCPNETTCCTGKQKCCPVENDKYKCCNNGDENVSISSLLIPCLFFFPVTENKYSNVVLLSISAPWSNRGGQKQPIPNHNYTINSHFSAYLLSRLGGWATMLSQWFSMCPQWQRCSLYVADQTCKCDLLRWGQLFAKFPSQ